MRTVPPHFLDCSNAAGLEVVMQCGNEILAQLVPRALWSTIGVTRLARLEQMLRPLFDVCIFSVAHGISQKQNPPRNQSGGSNF